MKVSVPEGIETRPRSRDCLVNRSDVPTLGDLRRAAAERDVYVHLLRPTMHCQRQPIAGLVIGHERTEMLNHLLTGSVKRIVSSSSRAESESPQLTAVN